MPRRPTNRRVFQAALRASHRRTRHTPSVILTFSQFHVGGNLDQPLANARLGLSESYPRAVRVSRPHRMRQAHWLHHPAQQPTIDLAATMVCCTYPPENPPPTSAAPPAAHLPSPGRAASARPAHPPALATCAREIPVQLPRLAETGDVCENGESMSFEINRR